MSHRTLVIVRWVSVVVIVTLCSCSFAIKGPPSRLPAQGPIACDTATGSAVGGDIVAGTLLGGLTFFFIRGVSALGNKCPEDSLSCDDGPTTQQTITAGVLGATFASIFYLSAYVGSRNAASCRRVKAETGR